MDRQQQEPLLPLGDRPGHVSNPATLPFGQILSHKRQSPEGLKTRWEFVQWSKEAEENWLHSVDIGLMPLEDDEWSRGKCAFKLLQYMAHGKPVVASAVGANLNAVIHGTSGFLAPSVPEWAQALETLVSNPDKRRAMGKESLKHFLSTYERQQVQEKMATLLHNHFRQAKAR